MESTEHAQPSRNHRFGLTRFIVPHPSFDWYMRSIGITALAAGALLGLGSWLYHQELFAALGMSQLTEQPALLERYARLSMISMGMVGLGAAVSITLVAGFLLHRITGPVYHLQKHMRGIIDGQPMGELQFRKTDQLDDLRDTYNQLLHSLDLIEPKPMEESGADLGTSPNP